MVSFLTLILYESESESKYTINCIHTLQKVVFFNFIVQYFPIVRFPFCYEVILHPLSKPLPFHLHIHTRQIRKHKPAPVLWYLASLMMSSFFPVLKTTFYLFLFQFLQPMDSTFKCFLLLFLIFSFITSFISTAITLRILP